MTSETACELCQGTKWVEVPDGIITVMKRCACLQREIARARLAAAMIPRRYEHCSLDNLLTYGNPGLKRAVERSRRFIDEFPDVDRSLLLTGPSGRLHTLEPPVTVRPSAFECLESQPIGTRPEPEPRARRATDDTAPGKTYECHSKGNRRPPK